MAPGSFDYGMMRLTINRLCPERAKGADSPESAFPSLPRTSNIRLAFAGREARPVKPTIKRRERC
jgi:hypothetical protein